jgi:hypothetical protein
LQADNAQNAIAKPALRDIMESLFKVVDNPAAEFIVASRIKILFG